MSNTAEQLLFKALTLLETEKLDEATVLLREAIEVATYARRELELIRAHTLLGEVLAAGDDAPGALENFEEALVVAATFAGDPASIHDEVSACREAIAVLTDTEPQA